MDIPKAVLFDHDGTIVDSEQAHYEIWCDVLGEFGSQFTGEMYAQNCVGVPTQGNVEYLLETFPLNDSAENLLRRKAEATSAFLHNNYFPLLPGVRQVMRGLQRQNVRMAVVSGSERFAVLRSIAGNDIGGFIEFVATGDQVANNKPAPDVYLYALGKLGLSAAECMALEDTEHGVHAATRAGIATVAIPNCHSQGHDFSGAVRVLGSISELTFPL